MKKLLLPILFLLPACYVDPSIGTTKRSDAMLNIEDCSPTLQKYVFALNPQMDNMTSDQLANLETMASRLDALNAMRDTAGLPPLAILRGYMAADVEDREGDTYLCSIHPSAGAIDVDAYDGELPDYLSANGVLDAVDLYMADPNTTPGDIHLQIMQDPSGDRIFTPF